MFPTDGFNLGPTGFPIGAQYPPASYYPAQFDSNAFDSQGLTQFYQFTQPTDQSSPVFLMPYPQASEPYTPGQLPSSSSSRLHQHQQEPLPGFSQYYTNYSSQNQLPGYQYGLSQFQQPSSTFQPLSQDGHSPDKRSHRRSKQNDTQSRSSQQTLVTVELNANTDQALEEPPNKHRHREHRTDSGINSQKAASGPISSSIQPSIVIREATGRKQSPQPSWSTSRDPSRSNGSQAATTDTTAKKQQNQREETAAQLAHVTDAHINNRQVAGGSDSDVKHEVPATTPQSVFLTVRPQVIPEQHKQQQQGIRPTEQIHGQQNQRVGTAGQLAHTAAAHVNNRQVAGASGSNVQHQVLATIPQSVVSTVRPQVIPEQHKHQQQGIRPTEQIHGQQNQRVGTAGQLAHTAAAHVNNRQEAGGSGSDSDVQHQVPAATLSSESIDDSLSFKLFDAKRTSVKGLSQAACSHLWFQRIKEVFLSMGDEKDAFSRSDMKLARDDMIETCEQYLERLRPTGGGANLNEPEQKKLDAWKNRQLYAETFKMSYSRKNPESDDKTVKASAQTELSRGEMPNFDNPIWWYSCNEAHIFDQMNDILRLENFELLMSHRYFISDLCQMIERLYARNKPSKKLVVYRADKLSHKDFKTIKSQEEKGGIIAINGFISTSKEEKISREYADHKLKQGGKYVVILYEITIDPETPCSAFADIESISFHPREREVLFNMGSTFKIKKIEEDRNNKNIQRIKLTAEDWNMSILEETKAKIKQSSQAALSILLVRYLMGIGEDRVSKRYLNQIIKNKQLENDPNLASVYNCLGNICARQALYHEALNYYREALNAQARLQFSNNNALAEIFNNIGETHLELNQLEEAQENLEEGVRIQKREPKSTQQHLASLYYNMGKVAYAQHEYDGAEVNFNQSNNLLSIRKRTKFTHDSLEKRLLSADLLVAMGYLKNAQKSKDSTKTEKQFTEALEIYKSILPSTHPKVAETQISIFCEYVDQKNFSSAIDYQKQHLEPSLKEYEDKQITTQQELANLYAIVGACLVQRKKFDDAMEMWKKGIYHEQKTFLDQLLSSARVSKIKLDTRFVQGAYRTALDHYKRNNNSHHPAYLGILYAKGHNYDQAIYSLQGQSSIDLANRLILQRNFQQNMNVYKQISQDKKEDITLRIGILLQMFTAKTDAQNEYPIDELNKLDVHLTGRNNDTGNRLRMIIKDCLAKNYLSLKDYDQARMYSDESFKLKQSNFSSHHPSLARNHLLTASCAFQQEDYKRATEYYEKAIEIQRNNSLGNDRNIRSTYFLMGDCYCKMGKIELAKENYDRAQEFNEDDADADEKPEQGIKALISMHSNLANSFAKQKDFASARSHQENIIKTIEEILPIFVVELIENENASSVTLENLKTLLKNRLGLTNRTKFAQFLQNFVFIESSLGRAKLLDDESTEDDDESTEDDNESTEDDDEPTEDDDESTEDGDESTEDVDEPAEDDDESTEYDEDPVDLYEKAIELDLKLSMFETADKNRLSKLYEELSSTLKKHYNGETESVLKNLADALDGTTNVAHKRSLEFRLGNLHFDEENFPEANRFWKRALKNISPTQTTIKTIIEELLKKNNSGGDKNTKKADKESEKNNEDNADQLSQHSETPSQTQSVKSQRRQSIKSVNDKTNPEEYAQAYFELEDDKNALKYFKQYITKSKETLKASWPDTTIQNEQLPIVNFFLPLLAENINSIVSSPSKSKDISHTNVWTNLLQVYIKTFDIATRMGDSSGDITKAYFEAFCICRKSYDMPKNLIQAFDLLFKGDPNKLPWMQLIPLLPYDQLTTVLMRIAARYDSKKAWKDALKIYVTLQNTIQNNDILKSAVSYSLLELFRSHLVAEQEYHKDIVAVNIYSTNISIFDRIILCQRIISFMEELDDETTADIYLTELLKLRTEAWVVIDLETTDCIGHVLTRLQHNSITHQYWYDLKSIYESMLPEFIVTRLYSKDSNFEHIFRAVEEMNNDLLDNIHSLAKSYESIATYEEKTEHYKNACESLRNAMAIWSKIPSKEGKLEQAKAKIEAWQNKRRLN